MITFEDGPAKGQTFCAARAPYLLRITCDGTKWDLLNDPHDEACPSEKLYAYECLEWVGYAFIDGAKFRGSTAIAKYRFIKHQPSDAQMRDNTEWAKWCEQPEWRSRFEHFKVERRAA